MAKLVIGSRGNVYLFNSIKMETLSEILNILYPQYRVVSEPLHLDNDIFIIVNSANYNETNCPVSGRLFQCFGDKYTPTYKEIEFKKKYVSIQISDSKDWSLIGKSENGQMVDIVYNKETKLFEEK